MQNWHLWFMGLLATIYGVVVVADYAAVAYKLEAYLNIFTPEQQAWFMSMPAWVNGVWGAQVSLALLGGITLLLSSRAAVSLLGLSFITNTVLTVWLLLLASPTMVSVTGWQGCFIMTGSLVLSLLFWIYARGEKQRSDGVL